MLPTPAPGVTGVEVKRPETGGCERTLGVRLLRPRVRGATALLGGGWWLRPRSEKLDEDGAPLGFSVSVQKVATVFVEGAQEEPTTRRDPEDEDKQRSPETGRAPHVSGSKTELWRGETSPFSRPRFSVWIEVKDRDEKGRLH